MKDFYEYLMFHLDDVIEEFDDENEAAQEVCVLLSLCDGVIPETWLRFYLSYLDISSEVIMNALAFFAGMNKIDIQCDCAPEDKYLCDLKIEFNMFYDYGREQFNSGTDNFMFFGEQIKNLRELLI